jgi:hypothetical protein
VLVYAATATRAELAETLIALLRNSGIRVKQATAWDDHDARIAAGPFMRGELLTSEHPAGCVQVRVRRKPMIASVVAAIVLALLSALVAETLCAVLVVGILASAAWGVWRTGPAVQRALLRVDR